MPRLIAAFSAGSPKASQPMGFRTCIPLMRQKRVIESWIEKISTCPMWMSPDG
jgi:hypothetical protein